MVDSGAGRNLISTKDMPVQWNDCVADAPEQLRFATGGGMRPCSKAVRLKGEVSGEAWIWFPHQLPFFVQSHRLSDVTFHCPESAKLT